MIRAALDWVLVRLSALIASIIIPDPTDDVWTEYEEEA